MAEGFECPICEGTEYHEIGVRGGEDYTDVRHRALLVCNTCSFMFRDVAQAREAWSRVEARIERIAERLIARAVEEAVSNHEYQHHGRDSDR